MSCYIYNNITYTKEEIISFFKNNGDWKYEVFDGDINISKSLNTPQRAEREVIDRLKQNGLANNVFEMNTQEINAKLEELGVDAETRKQVMAWHGSPYSFYRFITDAIGTGEGVQAFGWGLYFTYLESIARNYATTLSKSSQTITDDYVINKNQERFVIYGESDFTDNVRKILEDLKNKSKTKSELFFNIKNEIENSSEDIKYELSQITKNEIFSSPLRNLYKVTLHKGKTPDQYTWLEWDRQISEDNFNKIKEILKNKEYKVDATEQGFDLISKKGLQLGHFNKAQTSEYFYKKLTEVLGSQKEVSELLLENGIDGIKYPAESISRGATSDTARGFNYVVFDENAITIEERIQFQKTLNSLGIDLTVNGFVYKNDVFINSDVATNETYLHEFSHLYNSWLKQSRPEVYQRGLQLIRQELENENSEIQDIIDYVKTTQPNLKGEALEEEILTEVIGRSSNLLIENQKAKKGGIIDWILDVWNEIAKMLGLTQMTPKQVANLTLGEYAQAVGVDLLSGKSMEEMFKAQEYFTRNADRLPLTLAIFERPEFKDLQGRMVNKQTVLNYLKQSGIKQIEKDLITNVIETNYQQDKKISYDELETTVRANIMPLERLTTSSYADYGMDNLGNGDYGEAKTLILNSPIEHGVTGHFSGDFKASGRKNIKYVPKQLNDNTWVAVEEGYEQQGTNENNIYQYVGTAGTKEAVDAWIENYNKPTADTYSVNDKDLTFEIDRIDYGKEVDEDLWTTQITLLKDGKIVKKQSGFPYNITEEDVKRQIVDLANGDVRRENKDINKGMFGHIRVWQDGQDFYVAELQSDYFQKNNARKDLITGSKEYKEEYEKIKDTSFKVEEEKYNLSKLKQSQVERDLNYYTTLGLSVKDAQNIIEKLNSEIKSKENYIKENTKDVNKEIEKLKEKVFLKLSPQEKQFIASQKIWEQRMVREAIKEASLSGATSLRFPTPYTLSVIEGYVSEDNVKIPYTILDAVNSDNLSVGDYIEYAGDNYIIINTEEDIIDTMVLGNSTSQSSTDFVKEKGFQPIPDVLEDLPDTNEIYFLDSKIDVVHIWKNSQIEESFGQPYTYKEVKKDKFKISDLSDIQQTVARKYEEITEILKQERGEENVEIITDENGFDWYETKIQPSEVTNPVIAFQKSLQKQAQLDIIKSENPAPNDYNTWIRTIDDIKTAEEVFKVAFEDGNMYPDFTVEDMKKALSTSKITVYSSYPITNGNFVTPSKMNAKEYSGGKNAKIHQKEVNIEDIAWIDEGEGQYAKVAPTVKRQVKLEIQKQKTKRGLSFVPTINGQKAGVIRLSPHKDGYKVDEVVVYDRFQGKGLGTRLYQEVAKDLVPQGKSLYSLNTRTQGADNIWQKFVNLGIAEKIGNDYKLSSLPKTIDKNGEPKLEEVTKFITNQNKTDRKLNTEEKAELLNFMISNGYTNFGDLKTAVKQAFYNDMGMFSINPQKLVNSGLYDKASANSLTDEVQPLIEALLNTDMEVNLSEVDYEKVFDKTLFGNFRSVPRIKENVGNTDVLDENLQPKQNNNTREKLLVASKVVEPTVSLRKIGVIFKTSEAVAKNNIEDVQEVLDEIVEDLAQYGIDLVGLDTTGNYRGFLEVLREFIINPNQENINRFSEAYNERFMQDVSTQKVETPTDKKYFYSETKKSEQEVFEEQSLIKQAPNLYYKVRRESIDSLLNKLNLTSQRVELEKEARAQEGFTNPEIALEVLLYKKAFKTPIVVNYEMIEQAQVDNFSGNYQYLTTDFVADFQAEMIKEKLKDSKKYKNFYSLFDINEKGLYLKDNDSYSLALVEMYADNNLRQYSLLSKQMSNLKVTESDLIPQERNNIVNNKQQLKEYKGNAYRIDNNNIIVKGATEKFIKIDNQVFESVQKDGELSLFSKIIEQPSEYYQIVEQPLPNLDIRNYSNLKTTPEKFLKVSSLKSKAEIDKLKNNNFDCI